MEMLFVYLFAFVFNGAIRERKKERDEKVFYLLVHSLIALTAGNGMGRSEVEYS